MTKQSYIKTFIDISITAALITGFLFLLYRFALPNESFLPILIAMFVAYLFVIGMFTRSFFKYRFLFQIAQKNADLNKILFELMQKSVMVTNRDELYQMILESAIEAIPTAQKGSILLLNTSTNMLQFVAAKGYNFDLLKQTYLRLDQTYLYRESNGKIEHTVFIDDPFEYDKTNLHDQNIEKLLEAGSDFVLSTLSTPVIYNETLYGMINIDSSYRDAYTKEDKRIIELFALEIINVLKLYNSMEKVNYYMNHDILTNTYNRKYFNELFERKLIEAKENNLTLSLISMDLNDLKKANDQHGHDCGDKLLVEFAYGIKKNLNSKHIFARYAGDEFQLLLENTSVKDNEELINIIQRYFSIHPLTFKKTTIPISFCYGIVNYPEEQTSFKGLIALADKRMYEQKRNYHNLR